MNLNWSFENTNVNFKSLTKTNNADSNVNVF